MKKILALSLLTLGPTTASAEIPEPEFALMEIDAGSLVHRSRTLGEEAARLTQEGRALSRRIEHGLITSEEEAVYALEASERRQLRLISLKREMTSLQAELGALLGKVCEEGSSEQLEALGLSFDACAGL